MEPMSDGGRVCTVPPARATTGLPATLAAAAVVAAAVAADPWGLRAFTSLRWWLLSSLLVCAALVGHRRASHPVPAPGVVKLAVGVLVGAVAAGAVAGLDPSSAWLGHGRRHLGVLAWVVFAMAAGLGARLAGDAVALRRISLAAWGAGAATTAGSLADLAGWDPLGTSFAGGRVGGLLGQPTTLGTLAVLLLPLVARAPVPRVARLAVAAGLVATVLATQSRGALLGLLVVAVLVVPWRSWSPARTGAVAAVAVAVLALTPLGDRLASVADSGRVDEWRLGADVLADRPVLGVGPEGYRIAAVSAIDEGYAGRHGRDVVVDRAHSSPLDVALAGGVLAGAAYVLLAGAVALAAWRLRSRRDLPAAAGAGAAGALAAGLVAFPTPEAEALIWLLGGTAVATAWATNRRRIGPQQRIGTAVLAATLAVAVVAGASDVLADRHLATAVGHADHGDTASAVAAADRATALRPDLLDAWYVSVTVAAAGPTILDLDAAIARVEAGLRRTPRDPALRRLQVELLADRAARSGLDDDRDAAVAAARALLAHDPTEPVALTVLRGGTREGSRACLARCDTTP